jgi:hypothetical protein
LHVFVVSSTADSLRNRVTTGRSMRIRAQMFLGIALLMSALMAIQWWLQTRQLEALELSS